MRLSEIGKDGQEKLKGSSVVVIGAGALGCPVLQYLAASGIGFIGIVDNDCIDVTNLSRQILYSEKDIDKPKPVVAIERLKINNPEIEFKPHYIRFNKQNAFSILRQYDIVVDCSDNFGTRYLINDAAVILRKPVVYGAIHRYSGQVMVLNYRNGPTLRCIYPVPPHPLEVPSCEDIGVLGSIAGVIGSMQATEVIKIILGLGGILSGKMFFLDSLSFTSQIFTFERDRVHSDIKELTEYPDPCLVTDDMVQEITAKEFIRLRRKNPGLKVIDLREEGDRKDLGFETVSIPFREISMKLDQITTEGIKVFYCSHGIKSSIVINYLQKENHMENIYRLVI